MAAIKGTDTKILLGAYELTGDSNGFSIGFTTPALDTTDLGSTAMEYIAGLPTFQGSHNGYYTGKTAGLLETELYDALSGSEVVAFLFNVNTVSLTPTIPAYVLPAANTNNMTHDNPVDGVLAVSGQWYEQNGAKRGLRVAYAAISGTGTQDSIDFGAQGTAGGDAYLFVQAITGSATNATIDVESAATEGGVYASEGTFTFSAVGAQAIALSGTVDRWIRINATDLGGATDFTVVVVVCIDGVTQ